jgi:hypothetical protein
VTPKRLLVAGGVLLVVTAAIAVLVRPGSHRATQPPPTTTAAPPPTTTPPPTVTAPPPPPTTTAPPSPPTTTTPPPSPVPMSWQSAGAFVVHTHDADPEWLGQTLRAAGFGWVAVYVGQAGSADPPDQGWIQRFQQASGLPVGGWSSLGNDPSADAAFAVSAIHQYGLSFYIADAEESYQADPQRSQQFVAAFRAAEPGLTAGLSSYCNAQGIGLGPWAQAGFAFLPQAYVNDFGAGVAPAACVREAAPYYGPAQIHPTVASYDGQLGWVSPQRFSRLLAQAGTVGFSVFTAETAMPAEKWQAYGDAIRALHIAVPTTTP